MNKATIKAKNRLALVFDFDETLAPDTFTALLNYREIDADKLGEERIEPLVEAGWNKKLAQYWALIEAARDGEFDPITRDDLKSVGEQLELYPDVSNLFDRVREAAAEVSSDIEVEFYLLTAGMLEIPQATAIVDEFDDMWGGELHFDEADELCFVKRTVSESEKIQYLLKLHKGLNMERPFIVDDVYQSIPDDDWYIPLSQIIYVGDGASDMPVFAYMNEHKGLAIAVFQGDTTDDWEGYERLNENQGIQNLAKSDYTEGSELMQSLTLAVESIAKLIQLRAMSYEE